jgi:hypothetical protein
MMRTRDRLARSCLPANVHPVMVRPVRDAAKPRLSLVLGSMTPPPVRCSGSWAMDRRPRVCRHLLACLPSSGGKSSRSYLKRKRAKTDESVRPSRLEPHFRSYVQTEKQKAVKPFEITNSSSDPHQAHTIAVIGSTYGPTESNCKAINEACPAWASERRAVQIGESATTRPRECFRVTDSRRLAAQTLEARR